MVSVAATATMATASCTAAATAATGIATVLCDTSPEKAAVAAATTIPLPLLCDMP